MQEMTEHELYYRGRKSLEELAEWNGKTYTVAF